MLGYIVFLAVAAAVGFLIGSAIFDAVHGGPEEDPQVAARRQRSARSTSRATDRSASRRPVPVDLNPTLPTGLPALRPLDPPAGSEPEPPEVWDSSDTGWDNLLEIGEAPQEGNTAQYQPVDEDFSGPTPPALTMDFEGDASHFNGSVEDDDWVWPDTGAMRLPQAGQDERRAALEVEPRTAGIRMPPPPPSRHPSEESDEDSLFDDDDEVLLGAEAPEHADEDTINLDLSPIDAPEPPALGSTPQAEWSDEPEEERLNEGPGRILPVRTAPDWQPSDLPRPVPRIALPLEAPTELIDAHAVEAGGDITEALSGDIAADWDLEGFDEAENLPLQTGELGESDPPTDVPLARHGPDPNAQDGPPIHVGWIREQEVDHLEGEALDPFFSVDDELQPLLRKGDRPESPYVEVVRNAGEGTPDELEAREALRRAQLKSLNRELEDERDGLQRAVDDLRVRTEAKSRRIGQLEAEISELESGHQGALQVRDSRILELQSTVATLNTQRQTLRMKVNGLERKLRASESALAEHLRSVDTQKPHEEDLSFLVERLRSELETCQDIIASREAQIRAREDELDRLRETIDDLEAALVDSQASQEQQFFPGPFRGRYTNSASPAKPAAGARSESRLARLAMGDWADESSQEIDQS